MSYCSNIIAFGGGYYIYSMYVFKNIFRLSILTQAKTHKNNCIMNTAITGTKDFDGIGIKYCVEIEFDFIGTGYKQ